jgi:hypothetical protein
MPGGTLTLSYSGGSLEIGTVITINESLQKSCTVVPLVSMSVADTFAVESRSAKTINISFKRVQPSSGLNNANWVTTIQNMLNRWQCRSDGFTLTYEPDNDNPYIAPIEYNGYVKSFSYQFSKGDPTVIKGSMEFHVGTMYCGSQMRHDDYVSQSDFFLSISNAEGTQDYTLIDGTTMSCVEAYTLYGGPESPFEYLTVTIPRARLTEVAQELTLEDGIVAGRNRIVLDAIGRSEMTVTKCKLNNNKYTITAYSNADRLRGVTLSSVVSGTPEDVIKIILNTAEYGVTFTESAGTLIMEHGVMETGTISFSIGTNAWYALQVAAMCMGCRIFFANGCAYVIDYRLDNPTQIDEVGDIELYPNNGNVSLTVNSASLGDEGVDTIVNKVQYRAQVSVLDDDGNPTYTDNGEGAVPRYTANTELNTSTYEDDSGSISMFGERTSNLIYLDDLLNTEDIKIKIPPPEGSPEGTEPTYETIPGQKQADAFCRNYIDYRNEPQQSIEYTVKEMFSRGGSPVWSMTYLPASRATSINDSVDAVIITNTSELDGNEKYQKLCLSTFERHYPQGTTTYTWGVMASIDLSSSTSQIITSLDSR